MSRPVPNVDADIIAAARELPPWQLARYVRDQARLRGATEALVLLQDFEQLVLVTLTDHGRDVDARDIDSTPAGRAFTSLQPLVVEGSAGASELLLPLLDGGDRVGVLALTLPAIDELHRRLWTGFAAQVAALIIAKGAHTDVFFAARRRQPMTLAAEMQWHLLPPLSVLDPRIALAGVLEPAYEVGGDAFDYAINQDIAHLAVFDAMGHGIAAAVMSAVAVGAYRHARRAGVAVPDMYRVIDKAFAAQFGDEPFVTAQLGVIDLASGVLTLVNAGHPPPLHIRDKRVIGAIRGPVALPLGLGDPSPRTITAQLAPGDRLLFYTDGVVDARRGDEFYGEDRLRRDLENVIRADLPVQEHARRLSTLLSRWRGGAPTDDATIVLAEWRTPHLPDHWR